MDRLVDKGIIGVCSAALFALVEFSALLVVGMLCAVIVSCLFEAVRLARPVRFWLCGAYLLAALVFPAFALFVPLMVYDLSRSSSWPLRIACYVLAFLSVLALPLVAALLVCIFSLAAAGFSLRATHVGAARTEFMAMRDDLREMSLALEQRNKNLQDAQDMEVALATLNERSRIARDIHDNVGHLLTRSILQVEALQVVHAGNPRIREEFSQVGEVLHEALDTVRVSVHDLHDESFDLQSQLASLAHNEAAMDIDVDYKADAVPPAIGQCFIAVVREALSNAARHSDADRAVISVVEHPAFYRLTVHDNGSVAPTPARHPSPVREGGAFARGGIGLYTMEDRVRALGGVFRTDYEKGFRVFVSVPKEAA